MVSQGGAPMSLLDMDVHGKSEGVACGFLKGRMNACVTCGSDTLPTLQRTRDSDFGFLHIILAGV